MNVYVSIIIIMSDVNGSRIFVQTRALGYVSDHVPHVTRYIKKRRENLVVTCVGKAFHTYGCEKFSLLSVSPQHPDEINCLAADTFLVFTACQNIIYAWRRGVELKHTYKGHAKSVYLLFPFGPHLISIDDGSTLIVWNIKTEEIHLELNFNDTDFHITTICHPYTYINKILLGSEQGKMQLWNINKSAMMHLFDGWSSCITVLEATPTCDVVAIGLVNGKIILHNIREDRTIHSYGHVWGPVVSLSFRTDGAPIMVSGYQPGKIMVWDMKEHRLIHQLSHAHNDVVTAITCLPKEPLMITSSPDNSLKMWIFDGSDGDARLLRLREGHRYSPTFIRFYGSLGHDILSSGGDSTLRIFNLVTEIANKSLGKASYDRNKMKKKNGRHAQRLTMSPIKCFATGVPNNIEFDDIVAVHKNGVLVSTWSFRYARMSEEHIIHDRFKNMSKFPREVMASSVCFSSCMNFVIVGYSTGHVDKFNVQSGMWRGSYGTSIAHSGAVRGVATDKLGKILITGGSDRNLKFWLFQHYGKPCLSRKKLDDSISFFSSCQENSLLAVALDDFTIVLVDIAFGTVVRKFSGHVGAINDITFSPDLRWLISSSMDTTIRIWDIPSSQLIDYIVVDSPCISLTFSPTGEYLATAHIGELGVYLWANKTLFTHVSLRPLNSDDVITSAPLTLRTFNDDDKAESYETIESNDKSIAAVIKKRLRLQISDLITLSHATYIRWQNILDIDVIKRRNKPKQPPKKPESAPFFLPTISSIDMKFDFSDIMTAAGGSSEQDQQNKLLAAKSLTVFGNLLIDTIASNDYDLVVDKIKTFSPPAVYLEVTSLAFNEAKSTELLLQFMKMIETMFRRKSDFELAQSYLGIFLKVHDTLITNDMQLVSQLKRLQDLQEKTWKNLEQNFLYCLSVINYMRNV